jgi:uncharacterized damage-inducible protein DinB
MKKGAIIKYWDNVRRLTLEVLEHFPDDALSFRPIPTVRSAAEQFDHILEVEIYTRKGLISDNWDSAPKPSLGNSDMQSLSRMLRTEHETTSTMLRALPPKAFDRRYQTKFGTITCEGLIYLAIDEEIHHRGNLYVYLRLLDIVPPQMVQNYGELFMEDNDG